jgi:hypothetical protein
METVPHRSDPEGPVLALMKSIDVRAVLLRRVLELPKASLFVYDEPFRGPDPEPVLHSPLESPHSFMRERFISRIGKQFHDISGLVELELGESPKGPCPKIPVLVEDQIPTYYRMSESVLFAVDDRVLFVPTGDPGIRREPESSVCVLEHIENDVAGKPIGGGEIPELLPELDRAIYLDSDVVVHTAPKGTLIIPTRPATTEEFHRLRDGNVC